jgi:hypothetical protein
MNKFLSVDFLVESQSSNLEINNSNNLKKLFESNPIPDDEKLYNLTLFTNRQTISRVLFLNSMYEKILNVNGIVMEFGVRWGSNLTLLQMLRSIHEPFNAYRKIVGFDTFEGFPVIHDNDGNNDMIKVGGHGLTSNYFEFLSDIMDYHENNAPINHMKKYELVKGDATITVEKYLVNNPETIIAFAYFDFDIYLPTRDVLVAIKNRLSKGAIVAFDELNYPKFPGETIAFNEVFGINNYQIFRSPMSSTVSYIVY